MSRTLWENLNLLSLQENIAAVESMDYDKMYDDLRTSLNQIAKGQWGLIQMGQGSSYTYQKLEDAYSAVRKQFDAIKDGELQADNAAVVRQLKNLQDQIIMAGEALYISLTDLEQQETSLQRQLTAMNRTVEEMTLRYDLGQISALQLEQAKSGRSSLSSGLKTLQMNIKTLKTQLELLIGADLTGKLTLGAVPKVTDAELKKIDLNADLAKAKEKSYELFDANETLKDAKEDYLDALSENGIDSTGYAMQAAKHTWQAAQHTYQSTVQDYELRFRTLHAQVLDDQQILQAAKVSLGLTLNMMSLGGVAMGVGMIVDNSIVVLENIYRFSSEGHDRMSACVNGTKEVVSSVVASTLTTLAVFVPLGLVEGLWECSSGISASPSPL